MSSAANGIGTRTRRRKSKVILNRARLDALMAQRGIKDSHGLAELVMNQSRSGADKLRRIKDILDGEEPKRSTVNEIARALDTSSFELIDQQATAALNAEIDAHNKDIDELEAQQRRQQEVVAAPLIVKQSAKSRSLVAVLLLGLVGLAALWFAGLRSPSIRDQPPKILETTKVAADPMNRPSESKPSPRRPRLAIYTPKGPESNRVALALTSSLGDYWPGMDQEFWRSEDDTLPPHFDQALHLRTEKEDGFIILWVSVSQGRGSDRRALWSHVMPEAMSDQSLRNHSRFASQRIDALLTSDAAYPDYSHHDIGNYIRGTNQLQFGRSEIKFLRAQSIFQKLIDKHPNWASARSMLCASFVEEYRLLYSPSALEAAKPHCEEAIRLWPNSTDALIANAQFSRQQKDLDTAEVYLRKALEIDNENANTLVSLSQLLAKRWATDGTDATMAEALEFADQSISVAPDNWKTHFERGRLGYLTDDINVAIERSETALSLNANINTYGNLSAMQMCRGAPGDIEKAAKLLESSKLLVPESLVVRVNLGSAHYLLGNFKDSARELKKAVEIQEAAGGLDHRVWGDYGDALRQLGRERTTEAYRKAIELANSAIVNGESENADRVATVYYRAAILSFLQAGNVDQQQPAAAALIEQLVELEAEQLDPASTHLLARSWLILGRTAKARQTIESADRSCPGYLKGLYRELAG